MPSVERASIAFVGEPERLKRMASFRFEFRLRPIVGFEKPRDDMASGPHVLTTADPSDGITQ